MQHQVRTKEQFITEVGESPSQMTASDVTQKTMNDPGSSYLEIISSLTEAVYVIQDDQIKFANKACLELTGYSIEEGFAANAVDAFVHPDDKKIILHYRELRFQGDIIPHRYEFRLVCKDGFVKWVEVRTAIISWEGRPASLGVATDISGRKEAENALRESEEKYRQLVENAYDIVYATDANGWVTYANPACLRHGQYSPEDIIGRHYLEFVPENYREEVGRFYGRQFVKKIPDTSFEVPLMSKDGEISWYSQNTKLLMKGDSVVGFQSIARDITHHKHAEEALQESERKYRELTEFLPQAVFEVDANMRIAFVNNASVEMSGYTLEEILSEVHPLTLVIPEERARLAEDFQKVIEGQTIQLAGYTGLKKDGTTISVLGSAAPTYKNEKIVGVRGVLSDITALKLAELENRTLQTQLFQSQKMEALGTLVGGIAHDFNNMLQIIIGYCEILLTNRKKDERDYRHLQTIILTARGGAELVGKLLAFGQQDQGIPVPLDLNQELRLAPALLSRTLPHIVQIDLDLVNEPAMICADPNQIEQAVMNLGINASEAMPLGGSLKITTKIVTLDENYFKFHPESKPGNYVMLSFKDSGRGMNEQTLSKIFEPFFSTKERGATRGTGLGLSVVRGIVRQNGGFITFESEPGKGTEFKLYFPALEPPLVPEKTPVTSIQYEKTNTILIVEDNIEVAEFEQMGLESAGYKVIQATNGKEAFDIYRTRRDEISLVILDLLLPEISGRDCLMELVRIDPSVRVLIASGYSPEDDLRREIAPLVRGFLHKPFTISELINGVQTELNSN